MQALVLEKQNHLALRDFDLNESLGSNDVRIDIKTVGICGSDLHYYTHGRIGPFIVDAPMILGHEDSGIITEIGSDVANFAIGDRVCMEPGIPNPLGRATQLGLYNLDPDVRFWATPPINGVLRPSVVHPAQFIFKVPSSVSLSEAALVEPLAVGMHAATKAHVKPGDVAVVLGAGTIGLVTALNALAAGCSHVFITDVSQPKLDLASSLGPITPVNIAHDDLGDAIAKATNNWGADIVFEASGNPRAPHPFSTPCVLAVASFTSACRPLPSPTMW
ncbi:MAG: alcohol dehydrogenase catalytic domain-containing protein [Candidatus Synoicihabitans palmerolidicus]|nr:alcohol dehydrogenase catalytic domain-containing protein [Candidatus Synoicihabitans palmerolidicus]